MLGIPVLFLITLVISYVFKKINTAKIWITYIVDAFVIAVLFYLSGPNAVKSLLEDSSFVYIIISLFLGLLFLQLIANFLVIGKPFIKGTEIKLSSDILDDGFIK